MFINIYNIPSCEHALVLCCPDKLRFNCISTLFPRLCSIGSCRVSERTTRFPSISVTTCSSTWGRTGDPPIAGSSWVLPGLGQGSTSTLLVPAPGIPSSEDTRGMCDEWNCSYCLFPSTLKYYVNHVQ